MTNDQQSTTTPEGAQHKAAPNPDKKVKYSKGNPEAPEKPRREGPGRPPGSPNKPKAEGERARVRRVAPEEIKDTKRALTDRADELRRLSERHNRLHPGDQYHVAIVAGEPPRKFSPQKCEMAGAALVLRCSQWWKVEPIFDDDALTEWGEAASECSRYLPEIDPKWMAIGGLALASIALLGPMYQMRNGGAPPPRPTPQPASPPAPEPTPEPTTTPPGGADV